MRRRQRLRAPASDALWRGRRVEEFIVKSLDKCAEFEDFPAHLDAVELTRGEKHSIYQSLPNRDYKTKDELTADIE
jgi:hypothetical protein